MRNSLKIILAVLILCNYMPSAFAIGIPKIRKPSADNVSLKPTFYWGPIKNAGSYTYKLKQLNDDGTTLATLETGTATAPNTAFTVTDTLTVNTHYVLILRAVDGTTGEQSTKEKFYFQANDKKVIITHANFVEHDGNNIFSRGTSGTMGIVTNAAAFGYIAHAQVTLPDFATITGFSVRNNEAGGPSALFSLVRITRDDSTNQTISDITTAGGGVLLTQNFGVLTGDVIVNNKLYTYEVFIGINGVGSTFSEVEITYND